jgi:hypothetical protein
MGWPRNEIDREIAHRLRPPREGSVPFDGLDRTGFIRRGDLGREETSAFRRISPRHRRWKKITEYDEQAGDLDRRQAEVAADLAQLHQRLERAPAADAEALADWELNNRRGARPQPQASMIEEQISQRQADLEGIRTATERGLAGKATYVEQHRSQLTRDAGKATSEARSHYLAAVEALEHARGELLDCRLTELWALTYPDHSANREPQWMSSLARNLTERLTRAGISTSIDAAQLGRPLREDADALAEAFDPEQRAVVEPKSDAATGAAWADSDEGRAAAREDKRKARERYEREWGQVPGW